jgi:hypothetical protein
VDIYSSRVGCARATAALGPRLRRCLGEVETVHVWRIVLPGIGRRATIGPRRRRRQELVKLHVELREVESVSATNVFIQSSIESVHIADSIDLRYKPI